MAMRVVALEEHVSFPDMVARITPEVRAQAGWPPANTFSTEQLQEIGPERLRLMDEAGIAVQVLSISGLGAELLDSPTSPAFAREYNDRLARAIAEYPTRFAGFAHLLLPPPQRRPMNWRAPCLNTGFGGLCSMAPRRAGF